MRTNLFEQEALQKKLPIYFRYMSVVHPENKKEGNSLSAYSSSDQYHTTTLLKYGSATPLSCTDLTYLSLHGK